MLRSQEQIDSNTNPNVVLTPKIGRKSENNTLSIATKEHKYSTPNLKESNLAKIKRNPKSG